MKIGAAAVFPVAVVLIAIPASAWPGDPPTADAGGEDGELLIECRSLATNLLVLDGSASVDPDGNALTYSWSGPSIDDQQPLDAEKVIVDLPVGDHTITLTVDDGEDPTDSDTIVVRVADRLGPEISVEPVELWPPNHKYHRIDVGPLVTFSDFCNPLAVYDWQITRAISDEVEDGKADGTTADDIVLVDGCRAVDVRAERRSDRNGRVYRVQIQTEDAIGNVSLVFVEMVGVPRKRGFPAQAGYLDENEAELPTASDGTPWYEADPACEPAIDLCPEDPAATCDGTVGGGRDRLKVNTKPGIPAQSQLRWSARGIDSALSDFGDPRAATDYELCIYLESPAGTELVRRVDIPAGDAWQARTGGLSLTGKDARVGGLESIQLRAKDGAGGSVDVRGRGLGLDLPGLPLPDDVHVRVQLHNSAGGCWESAFGDPRKQSESRYDAAD